MAMKLWQWNYIPKNVQSVIDLKTTNTCNSFMDTLESQSAVESTLKSLKQQTNWMEHIYNIHSKSFKTLSFLCNYCISTNIRMGIYWELDFMRATPFRKRRLLTRTDLLVFDNSWPDLCIPLVCNFLYVLYNNLNVTHIVRNTWLSGHRCWGQ